MSWPTPFFSGAYARAVASRMGTHKRSSSLPLLDAFLKRRYCNERDLGLAVYFSAHKSLTRRPSQPMVPVANGEGQEMDDYNGALQIRSRTMPTVHTVHPRCFSIIRNVTLLLPKLSEIVMPELRRHAILLGARGGGARRDRG